MKPVSVLWSDGVSEAEAKAAVYATCKPPPWNNM